MRILYHHRTRAEDAQRIHIQEVANAFRDLGHVVDMAALVDEGDKKEGATDNRLWKLISRRAPNWAYELLSFAYNVYGYMYLVRKIKTNRPDLIYERYALNTFCSIWASRRFGIPHVLEVNAPLYREQLQLGKLAFKELARFSESWICSNSTLTIAVSQSLKNMLEQDGVPRPKLVVMHNGVDPRKFNPWIDGLEVRRRHSIETHTVIGFVGWFRKWHGLEMLLEIVHETRGVLEGVSFLLVGDGPAYSDLYRYAEMHELLPSVIFTGPIEYQAIPRYIAAMDLAVQPSAPNYACPMKIVEYMSMGKCVVAPDQANVRELLENDVTGFLFPPGNKQSLRSVLLDLARDRSKRESTGKRAHSTVIGRKLFWSENAERTLRLVSARCKVLRSCGVGY